MNSFFHFIFFVVFTTPHLAAASFDNQRTYSPVQYNPSQNHSFFALQQPGFISPVTVTYHPQAGRSNVFSPICGASFFSQQQKKSPSQRDQGQPEESFSFFHNIGSLSHHNCPQEYSERLSKASTSNVAMQAMELGCSIESLKKENNQQEQVEEDKERDIINAFYHGFTEEFFELIGGDALAFIGGLCDHNLYSSGPVMKTYSWLKEHKLRLTTDQRSVLIYLQLKERTVKVLSN